MSRADFEKEFGNAFRKPGYFAQFAAFVAELVPNVGPLKHALYRPLPEDAQQRFRTGLEHVMLRYRRAVAEVRAQRLELPNQVLDTGEPTRPATYAPADDAYRELLAHLDKRDFATTSPELRADILRYYRDGRAPRDFKNERAANDFNRQLARLAELPASAGARTGAADAPEKR